MTEKLSPRRPLGTATASPARPATPRPAAPSVAAPSLPTNDREFVFSAADFERVRALIYKHAGISLSPVKQDMVYSRLARRLRARGDKTFSAYLDRAERDLR